ncbi:TetR family transcriptional regulator [Paraburkholderia youngii]|uniref:TetR family transcriptional regulator n=1 Tax=Paraburkholderia youngii TaxID=2782701 RepID=UPI003D1CD996
MAQYPKVASLPCSIRLRARKHAHFARRTKRWRPDAKIARHTSPSSVMDHESRKKQQLVDVALRLFNRSGFHATGVDTLLAEADISKSVLYKHFGSKDELIVNALRQLTERARATWDAALENRRRTPEQKLLARFDELKHAVENGVFLRCIFLQSCGEYDEGHPIHQAALDYKLASLEFTGALVNQLDVRRPAQLAREIDLIHEGVLAKLQTKHDVACIADAKRLVKQILQAGAATKKRTDASLRSGRRTQSIDASQ